MVIPAPPFAFYMGGETYAFPLMVSTLIHGAAAVDDGLFPGSTALDDDSDSSVCIPNTLMFVANPDKPKSGNDYPLRQCSASGHWGAPHAMVTVDGRWYLRQYAPDSRMAKKYPPTGVDRG